MPLSLGSLTKRQLHPTCDLRLSVAQYLHLIITTSFGELREDEHFGCNIWDLDFDNITSTHKIKEYIHKSLIEAITTYEKRLCQIRVELEISQEEAFHKFSGCRVKKKITITIQGLLQATKESFTYEDHFYTGPYAYELN
jgi:phage baseplate assembly protein W